ncbi:Control catabolite protein of gluconeogenesis [Aedoeadaptatus ivorii]|uniref:Control catabolite protein of gluconeogenesis n=1 Tax=Aedoeadaptatus ivorii TaxID=54006 RepID=A0A448V0V5_9FIRM|nr:helix-turn-helix transcriptional regulator [Peptoniphilus ivorii]MDQ0507611.1 putative transcriptional regulator [Peptoniphilus ivorii]VEJ35261.1 Control catabolite protein of gluconeogenesis [Peptoniphilus ivorii]
MKLTERQEKIIEIVREQGPVIGDDIASILDLSRGTIRNDLSVLTMLGYLDARPKVGYFYKGDPYRMHIRELLESIKVEDVMSVPVVLDEQSSVYDGIVTVFLENIGTIFVTNDGNLVGCVSRKDLLRSAVGKTDLEKTPLSMIMTRMPNLVTIGPDESIYAASIKIERGEVDALPVIQGEEKIRVVGRITKTNINRLVVDLGGDDEIEL